MIQEKTLSDFMHMPILRTDDVAEILFDTFNEPGSIHNGKPIRLLGFKTDASQSDLEIREEGYGYYVDLCQQF